MKVAGGSPRRLPFGGFIERLKQRGFTIGVEHHLRLHALLNAVDADCRPEQLKRLLCPVFAVSRGQQEIFYQEFDRHFACLYAAEEKKRADPAEAIVDAPEKPPLSARRWVYVLATVLFIAAVAVGVYFQDRPPPPKASTGQAGQGTQPVQPVESKPSIIVDFAGGTPPVVDKRSEPTPLEKFWQTYGRSIYWAALAAPLIIFALAELYRFSRRRLVLLRRRGRKPPFVYEIRLPAPEPVFLKDRRFYEAGRLMRQRLPGEVRVLDVAATVAATARGSGYPAPQYRAVTRPPEYLVLIDLPTFRDHHARFVETLAGGLREEGLYVAVRFFRRDPQVCFETPGGRREHLTDLLSRYSDRRLLLCCDGDALLDPLTGAPDAWTAVFRHWRDRALLTPRPPEQWGLREAALARSFIVLPATMDGLAALTAHFEADQVDFRTWIRRNGPDLRGAPDDVADLKRRLGPDAFQWLCACAVYPELDWRLTLRLGVVLGHQVTEDALLGLFRLPWFRDGRIPDDRRTALIRELPVQRMREIRAALAKALEQSPPSRESGAWDAYRLNLAVNRLGALKTGRQRRKALRKGRMIHDYTLMKFLDASELSPLGLELPRRLKKLFFKDGISFYGLRAGVRLALAVLCTALVFWLIEPPVPKAGPVQQPPPTAGKAVEAEFVYIPPGEFMMGSPEDEPGRDGDESPLHKVVIGSGFYMQSTETTQAQWAAVMGDNPSYFKNCGGDCPVETVSWEDVKEFIKRLNDRKDGNNYRLPTEAEWEYACRARTQTAYSWGDKADCDKMMYENDVGSSEDKCVDFVKKKGLTPDSTAPVMSYAPNGWGLYDMHGNVYEWCEDTWHDNYEGAPTDGSAWVDGKSTVRVLRGGSWYFIAAHCRSALRRRYGPDNRNGDNGFRLVLLPGQQ